MDQLFEVDLRVRQSIFTCFHNLIREAQSNANPSFYEEVGFQLAFCYKVGFGVRKDENESRKWLLESKKHEADLELQLQLINSSGRRYDPSRNFGLWFGRGHVSTLGDVQYYREKNRLDDIFSTQENEIDDWRTVLGSTHWMVLAREEEYFHILRSLGHWDKAEDLVRGMVKNLRAKLPSDDIRVLRAQYDLAAACMDQRKTDDAERLINEVLQKSDNNLTSDQTAILAHQNILASVYTAQGKIAKAIDLRSEVYTRFLGMLGENHIQTLRVLWNLRDDYFRKGCMHKAASLNQSLVETTTNALGEDHELAILAKIGSAEIDWSIRRWLWGYVGPRKSHELNLELIRDSQRILGNDHPTTLQLMSHTAKSLLFKTHFPEAIALGEQIIGLSIRMAGADHPDTLNRQKWLEFVKATYRWYSRFEQVGTIYLGKYVITPSVRTRSGLERVWGPLFKKTDRRPIVPFLDDARVPDREIDESSGLLSHLLPDLADGSENPTT